MKGVELYSYTLPNGEKIRKVKYRIPAPGYDWRGGQISQGVDPDLLRAVLYHRIVENDVFAEIVNAIDGTDLADQVRIDDEMGMDELGPTGARLAQLMFFVHEQGLLPVFVRAADITEASDAQAFLLAWENATNNLRQLGALCMTERDDLAEKDLSEKMRHVGLRLKPRIRAGSKVSLAQEALHRIIRGNLGCAKGYG